MPNWMLISSDCDPYPWTMPYQAALNVLVLALALHLPLATWPVGNSVPRQRGFLLGTGSVRQCLLSQASGGKQGLSSLRLRGGGVKQNVDDSSEMQNTEEELYGHGTAFGGQQRWRSDQGRGNGESSRSSRSLGGGSSSKANSRLKSGESRRSNDRRGSSSTCVESNGGSESGKPPRCRDSGKSTPSGRKKEASSEGRTPPSKRAVGLEMRKKRPDSDSSEIPLKSSNISPKRKSNSAKVPKNMPVDSSRCTQILC